MSFAPAAATLEVADIVRGCGPTYRQHHTLSGQQDRVLRAIEQCRTAALGGHLDQCDHCGNIQISYNSCRNRHCPKCQTLAKQRWLERQCADLLPIDYFHLVFTLPHELNPLAQGHPEMIYNLLFRAASETLQAFGRDPQWLGGEIGITMVLHTWGQNLNQHIHVHCVVTGGALSSDGQRWIPAKPSFLFPVKALAQVFRGKYLDYLQQAYQQQRFHFTGSVAQLNDPGAFRLFLAQLRRHDWIVYAKRPFAGPRQVFNYLGRYTHRVAIANHRLVSFENDQVRFKWRDYANDGQNKIMTLSGEEFLRRFLLHVLPSGFVRVRHYGLLSNRCRHEKMATCRALLGEPEPETSCPESTAVLMQRLTGIDITRCPHCQQGPLHTIQRLTPLVRPPMSRPP